VPRRTRETGKLSVFKGREAKLNYAIFQFLALKGTQTIYNIHKNLKTRRNLKSIHYATVNKRVRSLEESKFIKNIGITKTKAGFEATIYELTTRAYLAIVFNSTDLNKLVTEVDEQTALAMMTIISSSM